MSDEVEQPRSIKPLVLVLVLASAGMLFLSTTQDWFQVALRDGPGTQFAVTGQQAATPVAAVAVAVLALTAALALSGPVLRGILALLGIGIGVASAAIALMIVADPLRAVSQAVSDHTGIAGADSIAQLVASVDETGAQWLVLAGAALVFLAGVVTLVAPGRWPKPERGDKYRRASFANEDGPVLDWDAVTRGEDPTDGVGETNPGDEAR